MPDLELNVKIKELWLGTATECFGWRNSIAPSRETIERSLIGNAQPWLRSMLTIRVVRSLAVEWVRFARANTVSPGYMATEISDFIPPETKAIWRDKIPMG